MMSTLYSGYRQEQMNCHAYLINYAGTAPTTTAIINSIANNRDKTSSVKLLAATY